MPDLNEATQMENKPSSMRRWIILGAILAVAAVGAFGYYEHTKFREETDDAQLDGRLHAVSSRAGGTVVKLLVKDNQFVNAGDVLLEIDTRDYDVALQQAEADLAEARANKAATASQIPITQTSTSSETSRAGASVQAARASVESAERQVEAAKARLESAKAAVNSARSNLDRNSRDLERYRALLAKDEISQQQFDATNSATNASKAQVEGAQAQVREAEQSIRVAQAQVAEKRADVAKFQAEERATQSAPQEIAMVKAKAASNAARVQQMEAAVAKAKLNRSYTTVVAPVSGLVSQRKVETGQVVAAGQPLLAVVPLDDVWVVANFKESQVGRMRPGQKVEIHVDAFKDRTFTGKVDSIAAATGSRFSLLPPENATGNYVKVVQRVPVKIVLDPNQDREHLLRPGMSVIPTVFTE